MEVSRRGLLEEIPTSGHLGREEEQATLRVALAPPPFFGDLLIGMELN